MARTIVAVLCVAMLRSTVFAAGEDFQSGKTLTIRGPETVATVNAVMRHAPRGNSQQPSQNGGNWIDRHHCLFFALIGAGAGAVVGYFEPGRPEDKPKRTTGERTGLTLLGAGIGAGIFALFPLAR